MRTPHACCALLTAALLTACGAPRISPEQRAALEAPARSLEARGQWREAGVAWQRAAVSQEEGPLAPVFRLNAADAFLKAGDGAGAAAVVEALPQRLAPELSLRRALVLADASLLTGDALDALRRVGPAVTSANRSLLARYRRIRSDALAVTGDALGAARERSLRDSLLASPQEQYRNRQRAWELLGQVPPEVLNAQVPVPPQMESGWFELAAIARRHALDAGALDLAIAEWTARYPGHPAGEQIVPELMEQVRAQARPPAVVALLLPQSGPFAGAAAAVRDGFMAAWLADAPNPQRPELLVRDSAQGDVALTYASALLDGADFVVGPLARESVNALLTDADLAVTTLMLNYPSLDPESLLVAAPPTTPTADTATTGAVDAGATPATAASEPDAMAPPPAPPDLSRVYYFALSPEDEAERAADFAYEQGASQAAVLAPQGSWGERVSEAFARRWRELGGVVADTRLYSEESGGLSESVESLLNIDDSKQRARDLRAALARKIQHEPQPRGDLDVIFMAAFPQTARQLKPLLLFHRAGRVPVVATSHVYAGTPNPEQDQDIEGTVFGDMPWLLAHDEHPLPGRVAAAWPRAAGAGGRLYAFGADAYALIARIRELRTTPGAEFPGLTGRLSLEPGRRLRRSLRWARIKEGIPAPVAAGIAIR